MDIPNDLWWGYCKINSTGWVLLDRKINIPGQADLWFVNCSNSVIFHDSKERWNNPNFYSYEIQYLSNLSPSELIYERQELEAFKRRIDEYRENLTTFNRAKSSEKFSKLRQGYFHNLGILDPGHLENTRKVQRISHCYNCKSSLNSNQQFQCNACGWMICSNCAACGCGYTQ